MNAAGYVSKDLMTLTQRIGSMAAWLFAAKTSSSAFAHSLVARVLIAAINFATGVLVARSLEAHGRGVQAAVSIWPMILSALFTLGIPTALRFYVPRERDKAAELFTTALAFAVALSIAAIAAGCLFIPFWLAKYDSASIRFAQEMMLFAPGVLVNWVVQGYLEATGQFKRSNALTYLPPLTTLALLLALAGTHRLTSYSSAIVYLAPTTVLVLPRLWSLRGNLRVPTPRYLSFARLLVNYGLKAFAIDILTTLSLQVDQALVIRFLSASQLGIYTVSLAVSRLLNIFSNSLNGVLLPKAAALERAEAVGLVTRGARITFAATGLGALVLALVTPVIVPFFYGHGFAAASRLAQILFFEVAIGSTVAVLAQAFLSTGRPGVVATLQGAGLVATVPFMLFAVPRYGLIGAACSLLASTLLRLVFVLACFPMLLRLPPPSIIINRSDLIFVRSRLSRRSKLLDTPT